MKSGSEGVYRHLSLFDGQEWMVGNRRDLSWKVIRKASLGLKDRSSHQSKHGERASLGTVRNSWQSALPLTLILCSVSMSVHEGHQYLVEEKILS